MGNIVNTEIINLFKVLEYLFVCMNWFCNSGH